MKLRPWAGAVLWPIAANTAAAAEPVVVAEPPSWVVGLGPIQKLAPPAPAALARSAETQQHRFTARAAGVREMPTASAQAAFEERRAVGEQLAAAPPSREEAQAARGLLDALRHAEDSALLAAHGPGKKSVVTSPDGVPFKGVQDLASGDLLLIRDHASGGGAVSAFAYAEAYGLTAAASGSVYGHVALVHREPDGRVFLVEAAAGGSQLSPLSDEQLREVGGFQVLRGRSSEVTAALARAAKQRAEDIGAGKRIPFDFRLDDSDNTKQYCAEFVQVAAKEQGLSLPQHRTTLQAGSFELWKRFDLPNRELVLPADFEVDGRLALVAEGRRLDKLPAHQVQQAVFRAFAKALDEGRQGVRYGPLPAVLSTVLPSGGALGKIAPSTYARQKTLGAEADLIARYQETLDRTGTPPSQSELDAMARSALR